MIIGSNLIHFRELPSTNTHATALLKEREIPEGTVIHTDFQSAGKGQPGNAWYSEKGKNLIFSIILYPRSVRPGEQFLISMCIALGISDFAGRYFERSCFIKWPNDIYINNDKIAGILIENSVLGDSIENSVAGIGININQEKFIPEIKNPASFKTLTGKDFDLDICFKELLSDIDRRYRDLLYGDRNRIVKDYLSRLYRLNQWHRFKSAHGEFRGRIIAAGITGIISIETEEGKILEFSFKEVDYLI